MIRIKNTADDRTKVLLHRTATRFELEPVLGDKRIRLRSYLDITEEHYARLKSMVDGWVKNGMVEVTSTDGEPIKHEETPILTKGYEETKAEEEAARITAEDAAAAEANKDADIDVEDSVELSDTLAVTTPEPAGAPVVEPVSTPPVVEEKSSQPDAKKGPGKKKLF